VLGGNALGFSLGVAIALDAERADGAVHEGRDIEGGFGGIQGVGGGEERRRFGLEDRAAIVKGLLGNVVRADAARDLLDFELVVADERAVKRQLCDGATACKFCSVCEATWPRLSPVITPLLPLRRAMRSATRSIKRR